MFDNELIRRGANGFWVHTQKL